MKKLLCLLAVGALLGSCCACSSEKPSDNGTASSTAGASSAVLSEEPVSEVSEDASQADSETGISYIVKDAEQPTPSEAATASPLSVGEWGTAAKFCTANDRYVDVPVRIVSIRRGEAINEEARRLMEQSGRYYFEPNENEEYAIAEYEISLNDFPVGEGGTLCDITAFITGENGEALALENGSYWGTTVSCLDESTYYYEGVVHSLMAFRIIKGRTDYLMTVGEYDETQTFFKGQ